MTQGLVDDSLLTVEVTGCETGDGGMAKGTEHPLSAWLFFVWLNTLLGPAKSSVLEQKGMAKKVSAVFCLVVDPFLLFFFFFSLTDEAIG